MLTLLALLFSGMYQVTVEAATFVQCDPTLSQVSWVKDSFCEVRIECGCWVFVGIIFLSPASSPHFAGSSSLLLVVKSPASGT